MFIWIVTLGWSTTYHPPVIPLITGLYDGTARSLSILLQLSLSVEVIVALIRRVRSALGLHYPRHQGILGRTLIKAPPTGPLLQRPDVDQHPPLDGPHALEQLRNGLAPPLPGREVVDDGDADGKVDAGGSVGQRQAIGDGDLALALRPGEAHESRAVVGAQDVQRWVDR